MILRTRAPVRADIAGVAKARLNCLATGQTGACVLKIITCLAPLTKAKLA